MSATVRKRWQATQSHWDDDAFLAETANAFMKRRWQRLNRRCAAFFAAHARQQGHGLDLVDVGCAHADFEPYVRASLASYTGIEPSKALLLRDRREGKAFRLKRGQAEKLPLPANCADAVLLKEVLDHCWGPDKVLAEAARVLRPGGVVLVTLTNDQAWYKNLFPAWAARIKAGQHDHLNFFHPEWVAGLLKGAGLERLGAEDSHYLRLPFRAEALLGSLPVPATDAVLSFSDAVGALALPGWGGSFWAWAYKPAAKRVQRR